MFFWTGESMKWYSRAVEYTGHFKKLSKHIRPYLHAEDTICDVGCGLGYIDTDIAPYVSSVIGIDRDEYAIKQFEQRIKQEEISNVAARRMDWHDLPQECCDTLLLCSFGGVDKYLPQFMGLCKRQIITVKGISGPDRVFAEENTPQRKRGIYTYDASKYLTQMGVAFDKDSFITEFGQPFKNIEEAERFISHYRLEEKNGQDKKTILKTLLKTEDSMFPYYFPNLKRMVVIRIEKNQFEK